MNKTSNFLKKHKGFGLIEALIASVLMSALVLSMTFLLKVSSDGQIIGLQNAEINEKTRKIALVLEDPSSCRASLQGKRPGEIFFLAGAPDDEGNTSTPRLIKEINNMYSNVIISYSQINKMSFQNYNFRLYKSYVAKIIQIEFQRSKGPLKGHKVIRQLPVNVTLKSDGSVQDCVQNTGGYTLTSSICQLIGGRLTSDLFKCVHLTPYGNLNAGYKLVVNGGANINQIEATSFTINGTLTNEDNKLVIGTTITEVNGDINVEESMSTHNNTYAQINNLELSEDHIVSCPDGQYLAGFPSYSDLGLPQGATVYPQLITEDNIICRPLP